MVRLTADHARSPELLSSNDKILIYDSGSEVAQRLWFLFPCLWVLTMGTHWLAYVGVTEYAIRYPVLWIVCPAVSLFALYLQVQLVYVYAYARSFASRYELSESGVVVKEKKHPPVVLGWDQFDEAVDYRLGRCIRIHSAHHQPDVVLFVDGSGDSREEVIWMRAASIELVSRRMGERYSTRWL